MNKTIQLIQRNNFLESNVDTVGRLLENNKLIVEFISVILEERLKSVDILKDDDSNWVIKRAIRDGRIREINFLKELLVTKEEK